MRGEDARLRLIAFPLYLNSFSAKTIKDVGNSSISASDDNASDDGDGQASGDFDASNAESNEDEDTVGGVAMTSVNPLPPPPPHMLAGATLSVDVVAAAAAAAAAAGASGSSGVEGSGTGQTGFLAESPAMASVNTAEPVFGSDGARGKVIAAASDIVQIEITFPCCFYLVLGVILLIFCVSITNTINT